MLKKSSTPLKRKRSSRRRSNRTRYVGVAALGLMVTLSLGTVLGPLGNSFGVRKPGLIATPFPQPIPSPGNPSKEYIYAGGKLIATEEPGSGSSLAPPASLVATTTWTSSGTVEIPQVAISWAPTSGADHYQVESTSNLNTPYTVLASNVLTTSFTDTSVASVNAYLYRVRAVDLLGNVSPYSNVDVATAITFTDNPLSANSTVIKAQHIWELRQAVKAVRDTANLSVAIWTDNVTSASQLSGVKIKAVHIEELRSKLDEALNALGLTVSAYTDPVPPSLSGVTIKKIHVDQLRQRVK